MGYGDYNLDFKAALYGTSQNNTVRKQGQVPQFVDFNAKEVATQASQMNATDMMAYLNSLGNDKKAAVTKELLPMVKDTSIKVQLQVMLDILKENGVDVAKVGRYTTQKAVDSVTEGTTQAMEMLQLAQNGATVANLNFVKEGDVVGEEFSKLFQPDMIA